MTTVPIDARSLPRPIRAGLGRIDRRIRVLAFVRGIGVTALVLAFVAALGMAVDFAFAMPLAARWGIWGAWVGLGSLTLLIAALVPLFRGRSFDDLAAVAESGHPELGERLTSAVDLLGRRGASHGSPAMIAELAEQASAKARAANLGDSVEAGGAIGRFLAGALLAALVIAPAFVRPDPFEAIGRRFLMPWADVARVGRFVVEVSPGDSVVAIGSDVAFSATLRPRFGSVAPTERAALEWVGADGLTHRATMTTAESPDSASRSFRLVLPRLGETIRYRVVTDSADSNRHRIEAIEPPSVAKIVAKVTPPPYTKLAPTVAKNPARIEAWEGSNLDLSISTKLPIASAKLVWPAPPSSRSAEEASRSVALKTSDGGRTWTATVPAEVSGPYTFALEDPHKITNRPEPPRRLVVRPDAPPSVALGGPDEPRDARPDDVMVLGVGARDDLAVTTCELLYQIDRAKSSGADSGAVKVPLDGLGTRNARGDAALVLKSLDVGPGDVITYRIRVTDSLPPPKGPNEATSPPRILKIAEGAEPLASRDRSAEREGLQEQLDAIKKLAAENRQGAEALRYAADAALRGSGPWDAGRKEALDAREAAAREVVDKLHVLARDLAESDVFAPLERPARQVADVEAEGGRQSLDGARRADDPAKRLGELRQADDRLTAVQRRLDEIQNRFNELARVEEDRRRLRQLAERQEVLADQAEKLADAGHREALERLRQEQDRLRNEVDEIARRSPALKAEALATQAKQADDLARRARQLAENQREEARRTADPAARVDKLRALAERQKQLEDDARRLAMKVDRPLGENGRAGLDPSPLARAVEPLERGEVEQGRQRLLEAEDALRRLSRDLEDVADDPKALARRLARRQEEVNNQAHQARNDRNNPAPLADRLKPLQQREEAIARLVAAIPAPDPAKNQANEAAKATARVAEDLKGDRSPQAQERGNAAKDALNRLADALPDRNAQLAQTVNRMNEARARTQSVSAELEDLLRQTAPRPDPNFDPEKAARELAQRVSALADRQDEAVRILADLPADRRTDAQRERALARGRDLADALDDLRDAAPAESKAAEGKAADEWRVLGAFDGMRPNPPFAVDRPIDLKAAFEGRKGSHPTWRPVKPEAGGLINLGQIYSREDMQCAYAAAEFVSPSKGKGRLLIGSDDGITIWLNGKQVFDLNASRSHAAGQDRADVEFREGPNQVLIRCSNGNGEWMFSVTAETPRPSELARATERVQRIREALPATKRDAVASIERLAQKLENREPADDRAAEIAEALKREPKDVPPADAMRQAASELRELKADDAAPERAEAIRRAERAARPEATPRDRQAAAQAAEALARRLSGEITPAQAAQALARAEEGLNAPEANRDAEAAMQVQRAIAERAAALPENAEERAAAAATNQAAAMAENVARRPDLAPSPERMAAARTRAAEALDALARRQEPASPVVDLPKNAPPRAQAEALAARQRELANEAKALAEKAAAIPRDDKAARARADADLAAIAPRQEALADAARALADTHPARSDAHRQAETRRDDARKAQAQALGAMTGAAPSRAADRANAAAEALDRLAQALPDHAPDPARARGDAAPPDPELGLGPRRPRPPATSPAARGRSARRSRPPWPSGSPPRRSSATRPPPWPGPWPGSATRPGRSAPGPTDRPTPGPRS